MDVGHITSCHYLCVHRFHCVSHVTTALGGSPVLPASGGSWCCGGVGSSDGLTSGQHCVLRRWSPSSWTLSPSSGTLGGKDLRHLFVAKIPHVLHSG